MSISSIARSLNLSLSTISREIQHNLNRRGYKAVDANNRASQVTKRLKECLLEWNSQLRNRVLEKIELKWSPEQISGWLRSMLPRKNMM